MRRTFDDWQVLASIAFGISFALFLSSPLIFTHNGFAPDLTNAMWLGLVQEEHFRHSLRPDFFINTTSTLAPGLPFPTVGMFNPIFTFYGGPLFSLLGVTALLLNSLNAAFCILTFVVIGSCYWGVYWIGRQLHLPRHLSHVPAVLYCGSAYYITDLYGRGDWTELVASSSLPVIIAGIAASRRRPVSPAALAAVTLLVAALTGSHNLTTLWSVIFGIVATVLFLLSGRFRLNYLKGWLPAIAAALLGAGLNAWFLLPNLAYSAKTMVYASPVFGALFFDSFGNLFDPLRSVPAASTTPALYTQIPVLFLCWGLIEVPRAYAKARTPDRLLRRSLIVITSLIALILLLLLRTSIWTHLPSVFISIEWPYRLLTYIDLALALWIALILSALSVIPHTSSTKVKTPRRVNFTAASVILIAAFSAILAGWQLWVPNSRAEGATSQIGDSYSNRFQAFRSGIYVAPTSWYARLNYADTSAPVITVKPGRSIEFKPADLDPAGNALAQTIRLPSGREPIDTNIVAGPYLAVVSGAVRAIGRDNNGYVVVEPTSSARRGKVYIRQATTFPIEAGDVISATSLLVVLAAILAFVYRKMRYKKAGLQISTRQWLRQGSAEAHP